MPLAKGKSRKWYLVIVVLYFGIADATIEVIDSFGNQVDSIKDRESAYDDDFLTIEGFITLADPPEACTPIAKPTFLTNFTMGKFVLINGTDKCGYKMKILNAENAGFDLAVIFDRISAFQFIRPGIPGLENIPVVLVSLEDGVIIKNNYLYNNSHIYNYKLRVKPNIPDVTYYMWLFGAVIGVCFFVMLLFMMCLLIKCIQERRRSRRNRLSSRQIKQIPTAKFSKGDQYDVCAICLEDYNEGDKLRILPCSHAYHAKCIDPWLMNNRRNCPLCKRKITFGDSADESESEDSELTSPAENTPLLISPAHRGQTWGTFVNPVLTVNGRDAAGPSSVPDDFLYTDNSLPSSVAPTPIAENILSEDESESLLPPPHRSVNNGKNGDVASETPSTVQVNFNDADNNSSNTFHGLSV
ncbi:E3 ubiquitin-protein ligase RNF13-like [Uloborus diversus]|uniref:E3 ubiquitin-protein ligase RNF13-like n=1 Tax=Uloborus diversus TaxID=327109 RepID=UPI00240A60D5|nr:E3 ubiquitin-protein ligase RNF13-like [Uloborus diversus]XP_054707297.1 E3 ubiquitin-protein ligase RNF13-like [Uloborus diversus]XP_054707298.1 E3 ubiquitin-protein ligase RNF13-like [Uloborus diversus]